MKEEQQMMHDEIIGMVREYHARFHKKEAPVFTEGGRIVYSGRVYDHEEMEKLTDAVLEFWLTSGRYTKEFEKRLSECLGVRYCSLVNSGSSANLAAFMALTSDKLGERRICRGDEVITLAAGFPTTVSPIVQYGAVPVFVDITVPGYNIDVSRLEQAVSERTKAVCIAHTLGNPFDIQSVRAFCDRHHLWLIEDNCDALGSEYFYNGAWHKTGTVGDLSTCSFYPPHHITMGEGGAVCTNNPQLYQLVNSFRDWGRDCWCASGEDNTCGCRYSRQFGELPAGYDHKYVYSHFGYNLKATDLQAAIGCAQLGKLAGFTQLRRRNWEILRQGLSGVSEQLILPQKSEGTKPSWFGFMLTVRKEARFSRNGLAEYLEEKNIQTRYLFAGNLTKQPCFDRMRECGEGFRVVGGLENTDMVMERSLWIGVYPGMTEEMLDYMVRQICCFVKEYER